MEKLIKIQAWKKDEFLDMESLGDVKIKNTWNYQKDYFILEIAGKEYMLRKDEFLIAVEDATNF